MKINNLGITSPEALLIESTPISSVCFVRGRYSDLTLDLIRETIGDYGAKNDPDAIDDGHFIIFADININEKDYSVSYLRNVDFIGDHRIAVNFKDNSLEFSKDDTKEFMKKRNELNQNDGNVLYGSVAVESIYDNRPIFIYDYFDMLDQSVDITPILNKLLSLGRQIFVAVCPNYPSDKLIQNKIQIIETEPQINER